MAIVTVFDVWGCAVGQTDRNKAKQLVASGAAHWERGLRIRLLDPTPKSSTHNGATSMSKPAGDSRKFSASDMSDRVVKSGDSNDKGAWYTNERCVTGAHIIMSATGYKR